MKVNQHNLSVSPLRETKEKPSYWEYLVLFFALVGIAFVFVGVLLVAYTIAINR